MGKSIMCVVHSFVLFMGSDVRKFSLIDELNSLLLFGNSHTLCSLFLDQVVPIFRKYDERYEYHCLDHWFFTPCSLCLDGISVLEEKKAGSKKG